MLRTWSVFAAALQVTSAIASTPGGSSVAGSSA